jgi:hypothetical protein
LSLEIAIVIRQPMAYVDDIVVMSKNKKRPYIGAAGNLC